MERILDIVKEFKLISCNTVILLVGNLIINEARTAKPLVHVIMSELTRIFFLFHAETPFTAVFYTFCCHCFQCCNLEEITIKDPV